ncbi:GIY-YIG nuclease family protein [Thalassotalea sp. HSM 43]|uniref:GIY-YIG nuclease family protein n=1 Tax=Thalassotalea sp. HSM 43 TaxID=2552945 RepID=UPI0010812B83|nr:GIY-YIG nuclease family protein [Thalassotalea sp. HSM 43]QBY03996.1 GIY-YIG nuclease family protein [Thalassotalea sp. HSM 43]
MKQPAIYILSNDTNKVIYVGVTSNLIQRIYQHKQKLDKGFSKRYNLDKLVYFEIYDDMESALYREKRLKRWQRNWKERLIRKVNPEWKDLYQELL